MYLGRKVSPEIRLLIAFKNTEVLPKVNFKKKNEFVSLFFKGVEKRKALHIERIINRHYIWTICWYEENGIAPCRK